MITNQKGNPIQKNVIVLSWCQRSVRYEWFDRTPPILLATPWKIFPSSKLKIYSLNDHMIQSELDIETNFSRCLNFRSAAENNSANESSEFDEGTPKFLETYKDFNWEEYRFFITSRLYNLIWYCPCF